MNFNTHHRYIVALRIRIRVLRAHCGFRNEELIEPRLNQVHILNPKLLTLCSPQKKTRSPDQCEVQPKSRNPKPSKGLRVVGV